LEKILGYACVYGFWELAHKTLKNEEENRAKEMKK
jgi:hypothetical protein